MRTVASVVALSAAAVLFVACSTASDDSASGSSDLSATAPTALVDRLSGKCLDVTGGSTANGTRIQAWDCNQTGAQAWTLPQAGSAGAIVNAASGKCLDLPGGAIDDGTPLQIWDCTGNANTNQSWSYGTDGTIRHVASGKCLDIWNANTAAGAPIELAACKVTNEQEWSSSAAGVSPYQLAGTVWVTMLSEWCAYDRCNENCWDNGVHETYGCCGSAQYGCGPWEGTTTLDCQITGLNPNEETIACEIAFRYEYAQWDISTSAPEVIESFGPATFDVFGRIASDGTFALNQTSPGTTGDPPTPAWELHGSVHDGAYGDRVLSIDTLRAPNQFGANRGVLNVRGASTVLKAGLTSTSPRGSSNAWGPGVDLPDYCILTAGAHATTGVDGSGNWYCKSPTATRTLTFSDFASACTLQQNIRGAKQAEAGNPYSWYCTAP